MGAVGLKLLSPSTRRTSDQFADLVGASKAKVPLNAAIL